MLATARTLLAACAALAALAGSLAVPVQPEAADQDALTLRIVHTNDMHARFEQVSKLAALCSPDEAEKGLCYGGFARIATLVRQTRAASMPSLFLNAGDTYQGSMWYNVYKWKIVATFMNILAPDAASLGNHEFDDGVSGLLPFLDAAKFPIVTANLDLSQEPELARSKLRNSTVLTVHDRKIGVIGYLTPETKIISVTEKVGFKDEVECIREEAKRLKAEGVEILIALGHSGFDVDKKIAKEVEDIDLVIGGHTNTFLYNGKQPDVEVPEGLYPTEVVQDSGRKTYVVQAYAYTKYLGNLTVTFDSQGEITKIQGNPILVDSRIEQAKDVLDEIEKLREKVNEVGKMIIGQTRVLLDGDSKTCRRQECNMGNIITDAMIDYNAREYRATNGWTDTAIAVQNSGTIRSSISRSNGDKVTMADVSSVLPFNNVIVKVPMSGERILSMLEWSVNRLELNSTSNLFGAFLQFSGLQVLYDLHQPSMSRVINVYVQCAACKIPEYSILKKNETYNVLMSDFLHGGGDGYDMIPDLKSEPLGMRTDQVLAEYIKRHSPVHTGVEWRISYVELQESKNESQEGNNSSGTIQINSLMLLIPVILQFLVR